MQNFEHDAEFGHRILARMKSVIDGSSLIYSSLITSRRIMLQKYHWKTFRIYWNSCFSWTTGQSYLATFHITIQYFVLFYRIFFFFVANFPVDQTRYIILIPLLQHTVQGCLHTVYFRGKNKKTVIPW